MTNEGWKAALAGVPVQVDGEGWSVLAPDRILTLYVAHGAAALTVPKVDALKVDGVLIRARTRKDETYVMELDDLFAIAIESPPPVDRKTGFSSGR